MNNDWIVGRAALGVVDSLDSPRIEGIRCEAIHCFRGEGHQAAFFEQAHRFGGRVFEMRGGLYR